MLVEADSRQPVGEVTDGGDGGGVAEVTAVGTHWSQQLLLSVSVEAVWWRLMGEIDFGDS